MNKKGLVINLIGGPGCGKSTTMAGVFFKLKKQGVNCEIATEFTKDKVWDEDYRVLDDQLYIIAKQFHRISRLIDKVDIVVMDTSLLSSIIYDKTGSDALKNFCLETFKQFNNMVFFIDREDIEFHQEGRVQDYEKSMEIDKAYKKLMEDNNIPYTVVNNENSVDTIIQTLKDNGYVQDKEKTEEIRRFCPKCMNEQAVEFIGSFKNPLYAEKITTYKCKKCGAIFQVKEHTASI